MEPKECKKSAAATNVEWDLNLELALNLPSAPKKAGLCAASIHDSDGTSPLSLGSYFSGMWPSWSCSWPLWSWPNSATEPTNVESPASTKLVVHDAAEESVGSSPSSPRAQLLEESYSDSDSSSWSSTSEPRKNKRAFLTLHLFSASGDLAIRNIFSLNSRSGEIYYEEEESGGGGGGKVGQQEPMLTEVSSLLEAERNLPIKKRRLHL